MPSSRESSRGASLSRPASRASSAASGRNANSRPSSKVTTPRANGNTVPTHSGGSAVQRAGSTPSAANTPRGQANASRDDKAAGSATMLDVDPTDKSPLTQEEQGTWKALEAYNKRLVLKLADLNTALDKQLSKQGINLTTRPGGAAAALGMKHGAASSDGEVGKLKHRIEALKRSNHDMQKALKEHNSIKGSGFDLRNKHGQLVKELETLRSENQSLENVYTNQTCKTNKDDKATGELNKMRGDHNDVQRESRDATRQLRELRESEVTNLRLLLKQQDLLKEKLRYLLDEQASMTVSTPTDDAPSNTNGAPCPSGPFAIPSSALKRRFDLHELQQVLQSLTNEELDLQKDIATLSKRYNGTKWKIIADRKATELEDLKEEMKLLKEHADAKRIVYM